jgi:FAD/FMN-containing dehydrogenase
MMESFCGSFITPDSPRYHEARQEFNRSIQKFPCSIAYCAGEEDVVRAIRSARASGRTVRVRSGGHSYEGFSVGDRAAVIDVGCMDSIRLDSSAGTVTAGPGVRNRALYEALGARGVPFPSGTCPEVAVAGLALGGGWGLSARMFGLACDSLISATLIDACGRRHTADATHDRELFFALRGGGGGSFGVATSLTFRLPPRRFGVTYVELEASCASAGMAAEFIRRFQRWLLEGDRRFTPLARVVHTREERRGLILFGIFYGNAAEARASLKPFLDLGLRGVFEETTFLKAMRVVMDGYPPFEKFTTGGRFAYDLFTEEGARGIVALTDRLAEGSVGATVSLYGLGGAVREVAPNETAFFYRNALHTIALLTDWEDPAAKRGNLDWFAPRYEALKKITCGSYVNFPNLGNFDYMRDYYGGNARRLMRVKALIDPEDLFCHPQSVYAVAPRCCP